VGGVTAAGRPRFFAAAATGGLPSDPPPLMLPPAADGNGTPEPSTECDTTWLKIRIRNSRTPPGRIYGDECAGSMSFRNDETC
jgi:hypothetical protein